MKNEDKGGKEKRMPSFPCFVGQLLLHLSGGNFGAVIVGTTDAAIGRNPINNVPMAVVLTSALY